eukprot:scaffold1743_cov344-Prasinococcus_capsulatus_cf.AAC.5
MQVGKIRWAWMGECAAVGAGTYQCTWTAAAAGPRRKPMVAKLASSRRGQRRLSRSPKKPMRRPVTVHGSAGQGPCGRG